MKQKNIYDKLIDILLKKANGFYYTEEQLEYEKTQNKNNFCENNNKNISFFDNFDMVTVNKNNNDDKIIVSNGKQEKENESKNLTLTKKKIATHYIPPDMLAIKILFEIDREKVNENDLENMSNEDLIKLKDKLIGELLNEDKQDK